jgi:hypothetical protein
VFGPLSRELAVVDLAQRRVVQHMMVSGIDNASSPPATSHDLWSTLGGLFTVSTADAKVPITDRMQASPDGRWLYAAGARITGSDIVGDGLWRIDTDALRVDAHWLAGSEPLRLLMSADGNVLYTQDAQTSIVHVVDTATGTESGSATLPTGMLFSTADLYRDRYGRLQPPLP